MKKRTIIMIICFVLIFILAIALLSYNKERVNEDISLNDSVNINNTVLDDNSLSLNSNVNSINNNGELVTKVNNQAEEKNKNDVENKKINSKFKTPKLSIKINKYGENEYWMDVNCESEYTIGEMSGYELYRSTSKDGEYELINIRYYGTANAGFGDMEDSTTMYYYKVREFKQDDNNVEFKEYTDFSNIVGPVNKNYK